MNEANRGYSYNYNYFSIPYANGKSALTEEGKNFTAKELEVFVISKL